jgi:hypothetical protein
MVGVEGLRDEIVSEPKRTPGREVWKSMNARGGSAEHGTTEIAVNELETGDTDPRVERIGLTDAGVAGDSVLPSLTADTSTLECQEEADGASVGSLQGLTVQEVCPHEDVASALPGDPVRVEDALRSVAEGTECVKLERVSVVKENALAGMVVADKVESAVRVPSKSALAGVVVASDVEFAARETEGNALAGVASASDVEFAAHEAEGNALAGDVGAELSVRGPTNGEVSTKGTGPAGRYDRLFTDRELDELELGNDKAARTEPEEYTKEMEERLFPLDDDRIQSRVKRNAEGLKKPSLAEMSAVLGIPVEVLERTKDVSSGALATPEYWLEWYATTLEASEEATRANRNFREREGPKDETSHVGNAVAVVSKVQDQSGTLEDEAEASGRAVEEPADLEREVERNVCVGLEETESPPAVVEETRESIAFTWRSVVRRRIYDLLTADVSKRKSLSGEQLVARADEGVKAKTPPRAGQRRVGTFG